MTLGTLIIIYYMIATYDRLRDTLRILKKYSEQYIKVNKLI